MDDDVVDTNNNNGLHDFSWTSSLYTPSRIDCVLIQRSGPRHGNDDFFLLIFFSMPVKAKMALGGDGPSSVRNPFLSRVLYTLSSCLRSSPSLLSLRRLLLLIQVLVCWKSFMRTLRNLSGWGSRLQFISLHATSLRVFVSLLWLTASGEGQTSRNLVEPRFCPETGR